MHRSRAILLLAGIAACARTHGHSALPVPAVLPGDSIAFNPATAGAFTLLSLDLPEAGATIGRHLAGMQFSRIVDTYQMSDGSRVEWARAARDGGDSLMRSRGYTAVTPVINLLGDAEPMRGVRFGIYGDVGLTLTATGNVEPFVVDGIASVKWVLLDFSTGDVLFEDTTTGSVRGLGSLDAAATRATLAAFAALLDQPAFHRAVRTPRPVLELGEFAHHFPRDSDSVSLGSRSQNMSVSNGILGGVLMLTGLHGFSTSGILLTQDGYVIASSVVARQRWLWAVDFSQQRHAARVVRVAGDVALVELSCRDCSTVAWTTSQSFVPRERVVWVGTDHVLGDRLIGTRFEWRRLKAHNDRGSVTWRFAGRRAVEGAAVAGEGGIVAGIVAQGRVVPFAEAMRVLRVSVPVDH